MNFCADDKTAGTSPDTSLALLQTELAKAEEESEVQYTSGYLFLNSCMGNSESKTISINQSKLFHSAPKR